MPRQANDPFVLVFKKMVRNPLVWPVPLNKTQAWLWLLFQARHEADDLLDVGELMAARTFLVKTWGWKWEKIRRFFETLKSHQMISTRCIPCRVLAHNIEHDIAHKTAHNKAHVITVVKILNFVSYQDKYEAICTQDSTQDSTQDRARHRATSLNKKETRKKQERKGAPSLGGRPSKSTKTPKGKNTKELVEAAIRAVDLGAFKSNPKYSHLDIEAEHEAYLTHYLYKNDEKGNPNWMKWSDWNRAFHTWLSQPWKKPQEPPRDPNRPLSPDEYLKLPESAHVEQPNS